MSRKVKLTSHLAASLVLLACICTCIMADNTVYVVISIDTENGNSSWFPGHIYDNDPNPLFDTHHYKHSDIEASTIFTQSFRNSHVDSFGGTFKMSWFAEMDQQFEAATYYDEEPDYPELTGTHVGYTGVMDTLLRYWSDEIEQFGDGIYWHHHVQAWTGSAWERTEAIINDYTHHFDALNNMLIERSYFPSVYRAGWLWEDSNINDFLNNWIPFDYSSTTGNWAPYHPSVDDPWSSMPPNLERWVTRSDSLISQSNINAAFAYAQSNGSAIYSFSCHDKDNLPNLVSDLHSALTAASADFPGVLFKYVNALDGIQNCLNINDRTPPAINIIKIDDSTYKITSNEPLWQDNPYVAAKYTNADGNYYRHFTAESTGSNTWLSDIPSQITKQPSTITIQHNPIGATASGEHTIRYAATKAIDGDTGTYWDSAIDLPDGGHGGQVPAWIQVELAEVEAVNTIDIHFYDGDVRWYTYGVEASTDGSVWEEIVPTGTVAQGLATHEFTPAVNLRYIRITVTDNTRNAHAHIKEIRLYGLSSEAEEPQVEVRPANATASSSNLPKWPVSNAIDNSDATWWDSCYIVGGTYYGQVPVWLKVDLGEVENISQFSILFYDNDFRSYEYNVQVSIDDVSWAEIVPPGSWGRGKVVHKLTEPISMRYLQIEVTAGTTGNPNGEFAHIMEVRFYTEAEAPEEESENETFYLEKVAVGASDTSGNPGAAIYDKYAIGGLRLVETQNYDGGWDWPLDDGDPNSGSVSDNLALAAMGLSQAYCNTNEPNMLAALQNVGTFLMSKTDNFVCNDGYLAVELNDIFGGTIYADHVKNNFYDNLENGTYFDARSGVTDCNTADYVQILRDSWTGDYTNMAAWELGMGLYAAGIIGANTVEWAIGTKAEIEELNGDNEYDVLGLAGAVLGLASVSEDFDPNAGEHAEASSVNDLAHILASYQLSTGGFTWNSNYMEEGIGNESIRETAYALLALKQFDEEFYNNEIARAQGYLRCVQLITGGWENRSGTPEGENNVVTGEALWGIVALLLPSQVIQEPSVQLEPISATASGEHTIRHVATKAIDGDTETYWDSAIDLPEGGHGGQVPAWIQLELAKVEAITSIDIHFYDGDVRWYTYGVEASTDGAVWEEIVSAGTVTYGLVTHEFTPPVELRYVRITVTDNTRNDHAHIKEIRLYGLSSEAEEPQVEVRPANATASSSNFPKWPVSNAIDNSDATWWDSCYIVEGTYYGQVPAWLKVDLGEVENISQFSVHFYDNDIRSYEYNVYVSVDDLSWTEIVPPGTWGRGKVVHKLTEPISLRYLWVDVTGGTTGNPHGEFAHIMEVRFYTEAGDM